MRRKRNLQGTVLYEEIMDYLSIYEQYNDQLIKKRNEDKEEEK